MQLLIRVHIGSGQCSQNGTYSLPLTIGRHEGTGRFVVREDRQVSSHHCTLRLEADALIVENRSQNGTLVGDYPLMSIGGTHVLQPGQTLQVGQTVLEVTLPQRLPREKSAEKILEKVPEHTLEKTQRVPIDGEHTLSALTARKLQQSLGLVQAPRLSLSPVQLGKELESSPPASVQPHTPQRPPHSERGSFLVTEEVPGALGRRWGGDLRLTSASITFGRLADVLLDDIRISRQHFRMHRDEEGVTLEPVSALHRVTVNGRLVLQPVRLQDRDVVEVLPFTLSLTRVGADVLLRARGLEHELAPEATLVTLATGAERNDTGAERNDTGAMATRFKGQASAVGKLTVATRAPDTSSRSGNAAAMLSLLDGSDALDIEAKTMAILPSKPETKEGEQRRRSAARWVPTSDLRYGSSLGGMVGATLLGLGVFLGVEGLTSGGEVFSPGPLTEVHQSMTGGDCGSCHLPGTQDVSLGCLQAACHANAAKPLPPEAKDGLPVRLTGIHLATGEAARDHSELPLACNSCHVEHRGEAAPLRSPPAGRCLECHSDAHTSQPDPDPQLAALGPLVRSELRCTACHVQHPTQDGPTVSAVPADQSVFERPQVGMSAEETIAQGGTEAEAARSGLLVELLGGLALASTPPLGYALWTWRTRRRQQARAALNTPSTGSLPGPPKPQFPHIDPLKCVGCRACVDACPFDALDIVDGVARLVSRPACHGVAICAEVCPTSAIQLVATEAPRFQAPINETFESTRVPGIFVVGDLSGLSLIKNAINTGVMAAEAIGKRPRHPDCALDVAVVGAGPAGLSAGLRSAELGLRYAVLEEGSVANTLRHFPRSKLVFAQPFDVPLLGKVPMAECSKEVLLGMWDGLIARHGLRINEGEKVMEVRRRAQGGFEVVTGKTTYTAGSVVLAIGKRGTPRKLGAVGEDCEKVFYNLIDAEHFKGRKIFVYGAGDVALETALALAGQKNTEVTLGYRGDKIDLAKKRNVDKLNAAAAAGRVRIRPGVEKVVEVRAHEVVLKTPDGEVTLGNDVVFACIGAEMPTAWLKAMGVMP